MPTSLDGRKGLVYAGKHEILAEGEETHTRTAHICVDPSKIPGFRPEAFPKEGPCPIEIPVTQTVIYGGYDNELGSYTNMMGDLTVKIAEGLL